MASNHIALQRELPVINRRKPAANSVADKKRLDDSACRLINADCIAGMKQLRADSIHFVATDPPYFLHGFGDEWNRAKLDRRVKPGVVGGLPSGMKFDKNQAKRLRAFMFEVAVELHRVLKPGGFMAVFSQARLAFATGAALDEAGFEIRDMLAWKYEGQAKAFSQTHFVRKMNISARKKAELIKQIDGRKTPQLKPQFEPILLAQKPREGTFIDNWLNHQVGLMSPHQSLIGDGFPGTIIEAPKVKKAAQLGHMTVKPVTVMRQLIRLFTVDGQTVLDPFTGSGTTAVAALRDNRKFIGFEIDADYAATAKRRIKDEQGLL